MFRTHETVNKECSSLSLCLSVGMSAKSGSKRRSCH
uniref:Uncharacterized protein n=1 Tax=Rhizophora mucronata TaxID=61149 RepID=A0A2P2PRW8_RHIMU